MLNLKKVFAIAAVMFILSCSFVVASAAVTEKEEALNKFYDEKRELLCISHRGDTAYYPENSLEGVLSALEKGADFVSVNVQRTSDGVFYICEDESLGNICNAPFESFSQVNSEDCTKYVLYDIYGKETVYKLCSLEKLLDETDSKDGIILDVKSEDKDAVYEILRNEKALSRVIIRAKENGKSLSDWSLSKEQKPYVIGKYTGNIIFSTVSQINSLTASDAIAVQYESKNYFNVAFGEFFTNRYLTDEKVRAVAATYSPDLCGQRSDGSDGWNELIKKGYSVIETNNSESFISYRNEINRLKIATDEVFSKCSDTDRSKYSDVSLSNLDKAMTYYEDMKAGSVYSLDEAQQAYTMLVSALGEMKISTGEVDTRGALNITFGKVFWAIIVGAALLGGQIYVYKMRKSNMENKS